MEKSYELFDSSYDVSPRYPTTLRLTGLEPITLLSILVFVVFLFQTLFVLLAPFLRLFLSSGSALGTGNVGVGSGVGGFGSGLGGGLGTGGINGYLGIGNGLNFGLIPGLLGVNGLLNTGLLGPGGLFGTGLLNSGVLSGLGIGSGLGGAGGLTNGAGGAGLGGAGLPSRLSREDKTNKDKSRRKKSLDNLKETENLTNSIKNRQKMKVEQHYCQNEAVCYTIRSTRIT